MHTTTTATPRQSGRRLGRIGLALAAAATVLAFMPLATPGRAATLKPLFELVGTLERFPADARAALGATFVRTYEQAEGVLQKPTSGTGIIIPEVRQLWQVYPQPDRPRTGLVVRDLDTMKIVGTLVVDVLLDRATRISSWGGDWAHTVDPDGGRLFLTGGNGLDRSQQLLEVDLRTLRVKQRPLLGTVDVFGYVGLAGMTYDPWHDDVVLLFSGPSNTSAVNVSTWVYRLDVSGSPQASFDPAGMYRMRSCNAPMTSVDAGDDTYDWEPLVTKDYLYVPCQRAGHTVVVVRTPRPPSGARTGLTHDETVVPGPVYGESVFADKVSGRLFVITIDQEIWPFEAATMSFVGVVGTGPAGVRGDTGAGFDRQTGRVYFQSPGFGLGVVEGRFFPVPQARTMPHRVPGQERILSDAATGRVFVLEGHNNNGPVKAPSYKTYKVGAAPVPPAAPDPDRNTADVDERDGVTESRWNATASGYGARVLLAKGWAPLVPVVTIGNQAPTQAVTNVAGAGGCGFVDRDLFLGRVMRSEYDTGSTAAQAIAVNVDDATRQDLNQASRCQKDIGGPIPSANWNYQSALCASNTFAVPKEPSQGSPEDLGRSQATCPEPGGVLTAWAETTLGRRTGETPLTGAVEVARARTETSVRRLEGGGVHSVVTSVAEDVAIRLGSAVPAVVIGEIRATATSTSNGRPTRKDMSTHDIEISHVRVGDTTECLRACSDEDLLELERTLNTATAGRAVFRTGKGAGSGRDRALLEGSNGGAQTAVQKSVARQAADRALVGDYTVEVPAFEVMVFNDNPQEGSWGRARQLYQFAGVASSSTYNVLLRPTFAPLDDDAGGGLPDDVAVAAGDGNLFTGSVEDPFATEPLVAAPTAAQSLEGKYDDRGTGPAAVLRAVARGLRVLLTSPRTALLLFTAWALLGSPAVLSRRRRLLDSVRSA